MLKHSINPSQRLIYQKRAYDQKISSMQTKLKQEFHQQQFAKWQGKGKNIQINSQLKAKMNELRQKAQLNLNFRRQQLASQLKQENDIYQQEIIASQQTPQQVRQRMLQRVNHLKQEKQSRRQQQVNKKYEKRFQQNADELRKVDQDLKELRTAYERNIQLVEKQNLMENQYEEEVLFAELNKRDIQKKKDAQKIKQQQYKDKVDERNAILAVQIELKKIKQNGEKQMNERQKIMLREEWQKQSQLQKAKELKKLQKMRQTDKKLFDENQKLKKDKIQEIKRQQQNDKAMIERIITKQRQIAEYEKQMKQKDREQAKRILMEFKSKGTQIAAYERQLDRLIDQQRQRRQKKQDELWNLRQKARLNLLHQVFDDRGKKVDEHRIQQKQQQIQKQHDKVQVQRRMKQYHKQQQNKRKQDLIRSKEQQQKLLRQIAQKQQKRRLLILQLHKEDEKMQKQRKIYDQKIKERKQIGNKDLQTFKQNNKLF